ARWRARRLHRDPRPRIGRAARRGRPGPRDRARDGRDRGGPATGPTGPSLVGEPARHLGALTLSGHARRRPAARSPKSGTVPVAGATARREAVATATPTPATSVPGSGLNLHRETDMSEAE